MNTTIEETKQLSHLTSFPLQYYHYRHEYEWEDQNNKSIYTTLYDLLVARSKPTDSSEDIQIGKNILMAILKVALQDLDIKLFNTRHKDITS